MKVNDFARQIGIPDSKVRYYDRMGLIKGQRKEGNNYRDFTNKDALHIYHAHMLRSFGMSIQESLDTKEKELSEIDGWLEDHINEVETLLRYESMRLYRLREMRRYFTILQNQDYVLSEQYRDTSYNIINLGAGISLSQVQKELVQSLVDAMPFSYIAIRISKESIDRESRNLDVGIGLGILEKNRKLLNLSMPDEIKENPGATILQFVVEAEDPFSMTREDLRPLLDEIQRRNCEIDGDLYGRIYISYKKDHAFIHVVGIGAVLKNKNLTK
jgi:DNA-binding transcriptional MerR regulator